MTDFGTKEWRQENDRRSKNMSELFDLDGRGTDQNHPHKGTYTGLYQEILIYEKWRKRFYPMGDICKYVKS